MKLYYHLDLKKIVPYSNLILVYIDIFSVMPEIQKAQRFQVIQEEVTNSFNLENRKLRHMSKNKI